MRDEVRELDKSAVLFEHSTIANQIGNSLSQRRFETFLPGLFSLLALILATVGTYGVVFQSVSQRRWRNFVLYCARRMQRCPLPGLAKLLRIERI